MKILSASQLRQADSFSIKNEPVSSLGLMERAARGCFKWIVANVEIKSAFTVICGTGNNGGDGLALARMLFGKGYKVEVILLSVSDPSPDFTANLKKLKKLNIKTQLISDKERLIINNRSVIIDAIFGTGLSRAVSGWIGDCIDSINACSNTVISIDLPSGLFADSHTTGKVVCATHTLTFQSPKLAFFFAENENYTGGIHLIDIGLDKNFIASVTVQNYFTEIGDLKPLIRKRKKFSHKGNYGHSLLIAGSNGKIGAAILAARACLRSGTGLLTVQIPHCGYSVIQTAVPEAMVATDSNENFNTGSGHYTAPMTLGIGPGIGTDERTRKMLLELLDKYHKPVVLDADALTIIAENPDYAKKIPVNSILTPHPKEFERLAGRSENDFHRHKMQIDYSIKHKVYVVLKGAYTCISTPEGNTFFNPTGNPGMAKGGSGDVLTGVILGLLAQHYEPLQAALIGVYVHGLAGDFAENEIGEMSLIATDIINNLPEAFKALSIS